MEDGKIDFRKVKGGSNKKSGWRRFFRKSVVDALPIAREARAELWMNLVIYRR
jgi:hypothetical protein